jgi:AraC family transcriptional regulator of adaptative response/methylated-DNA-[protein]-cysteine methyltransferase
LVAQTARGICALRFVCGNRDVVLQGLQQEWAQAAFVVSAENPTPLSDLFSTSPQPVQLHLKGTNFQIQVWQALLRIPAGRVVAYSDISKAIGDPQATRAVASAIAQNPVAYIIPCHRVINKVGQIHNYRWGSERKKAMVGWEASRALWAFSDER